VPNRNNYRWRDDRGRYWQNDRRWYDDYRVRYFRYDSGRYYSRQRYSIGFYYPPSSFTIRQWSRGDRLPRSYYQPRYVIADYWRFDLYDPPFGSDWVRVGDDALLIDSHTGEVLEIVYNLYGYR